MTITLQNFFKYFDEDNSKHLEAIKILENNIPNLLSPSSEWVVKYRGRETQDKVILLNFFKYFNEKNINHTEAVELLQKQIPSEFLQDSSDWVRKYRERVSPPSEVNLNVPYYSQIDNYRDAHRTCNSSSCAMCLEYFKPGTLIGAKGDDAYIQKVFAIGDTTDHSVQTKVLSSYGIKSSFRYDLGFSDLDRELSEGRPVAIGILHRGTLSNPTGGHILVVRGKTAKGDYYVNDPYGSLNDNYSGSVLNGKNAVYTKEVLSHRWLTQGEDKTGWGRVFQATPPANIKINTTSKRESVGTSVPSSAIDLIKEFEGLELKAYYDPLSGGLPITIGYGSTRRKDGSTFMIGNIITQKEAEELLIHQLENEFIPSLQKIPYWNEMNDEMRGSLLSFAYNLGANFYNSSGFATITRHLRDKMWKNVPDALMLYVNPGTNVEAGLKRRRTAESQTWNKGLSKILK